MPCHLLQHRTEKDLMYVFSSYLRYRIITCRIITCRKYTERYIEKQYNQQHSSNPLSNQGWIFHSPTTKNQSNEHRK